MPKVKTVVAMKRRLEQALGELEEQEAVIELVRQVVKKYELLPDDVFCKEELEASAPEPRDASMPYCDNAGNTWTGRGRRPLWLRDAIKAGAVLEDFRNPHYLG